MSGGVIILLISHKLYAIKYFYALNFINIIVCLYKNEEMNEFSFLDDLFAQLFYSKQVYLYFNGDKRQDTDIRNHK